MELAKALDVRPGVTAIIGGGGKTTLMECLAEELSAQARVIVCTTTHIYPEQNMPCLVSTSEAEIAAELARTRCVCVGSASESGKYSAPELPFCTLCALASYVIVEADGSKRLPLKAHAPHEPVIPPFADAVVAVAGLSALGQPLGRVCHRPELATLRFGLSPEETVTPEIMARLLSSPLAQRKGVGDRPYAVLLNQADAAPPGGADAVAAFLLQNGVQRVVAAALQHRPGEYHVWTR